MLEFDISETWWRLELLFYPEAQQSKVLEYISKVRIDRMFKTGRDIPEKELNEMVEKIFAKLDK